MHGYSGDATRLQQALADREADVRSGRLSTIVYIRDRNPGGQEVSGYIDYGHRCARARAEGTPRARSGSGPPCFLGDMQGPGTSSMLHDMATYAGGSFKDLDIM
jgi:hypothetical protein